MPKCKVRAMVTLELDTDPFEGMPKNKVESQVFDKIKENFVTALFDSFSYRASPKPDIRIIDSHIAEAKEEKGKKKKEFMRHVPRYHTHVYKVKGKMVEVDWLNEEMSNAEARDLAIEIVKSGDNVNSPIKSDCEYVAVTFKLLK